MQTRLKFFAVQVLLAALLTGCTSTGNADNRWTAEATTIGVTKDDIAEVTRIAAERYRLVVVRVQKADGGGIAVYLADKPNRPHGIVVVFRKVDGRWQEDPKSKDEWII